MDSTGDVFVHGVRAYSHEEYLDKVHFGVLPDELSMPSKVFVFVSKIYYNAVERIHRALSEEMVEVEINRPEVFHLALEVYRLFKKFYQGGNGDERKGRKMPSPDKLGEVVAYLYLLGRGVELYVDIKLAMVVSPIIRRFINRFVSNAVSRVSQGDMELLRVLSVATNWFRSKGLRSTTALLCAMRLASILLPRYTYSDLLRRYSRTRKVNPVYITPMRRTGVVVVSKPPYTTVEKLIMPVDLCNELKKVVQLPSFSECVG